MKTDILHEAKRLKLLAAALELQHYTSTAANVVPIPGGDRVITIGTPTQVRALLGIEPIREASIGVLDALDSVTGEVIADVEAFKTERFYLADDVDGLLACHVQQEQEFAALLPGVAYMDPPDGGTVSVLEQVRRMAKDAARYRWLRDKSEPGICAFYLSVGQAFKDVKFARVTVDEAIDAQIVAASPAALAADQVDSEGGHHD